jgi:hypothetical protein
LGQPPIYLACRCTALFFVGLVLSTEGVARLAMVNGCFLLKEITLSAKIQTMQRER